MVNHFLMENTLLSNAMIVDDEEELCFLLSLLLKQYNLVPICANSIAEAKYKIKRTHLTMLFLDNRLPDGLGIDLINEIKLYSPTTKIIMMTAHNSSQDIEKAFQRGADYFISKPFNSRTIQHTIEEINQLNHV